MPISNFGRSLFPAVADRPSGQLPHMDVSPPAVPQGEDQNKRTTVCKKEIVICSNAQTLTAATVLHPVGQLEHSRTIGGERVADWLPGYPQKVLPSPGRPLSRTPALSTGPHLRPHQSWV